MTVRRQLGLRAARLVFALVTASAIAIQLAAATHKPHFHPANFFGYFTILSNMFATATFAYTATRSERPSHAVDVLRGAATLCLAIVGTVFSALLTSLESDVLPWVNVVVHYVMPLAVVADWLIDPPQTRLRMRDAAVWLALPAIYVAYTLVRGGRVQWYPYPFLNVAAAGAATVGAYIAAIFVFSTLLAAGIIAVGNRQRTRR